MGKVGTYTMTEALNQVATLQVIKVHALTSNGISAYEKFKRGKLALTERSAQRHLQQNPDERLTIITMTRDPLVADISSMFHNLDIHFPKTPLDQLSLERIREKFVSNPQSRNHFLSWFETEFQSVTDLDVYSQPFPHDYGYQQYVTSRADILVLRLENLNAVYSKALSTLLGITVPSLPHRNAARDKFYALLYKHFKDTIRFSDSFLDIYYNSKYACHFYTDDERASWRSYWRSASAYQHTENS